MIRDCPTNPFVPSERGKRIAGEKYLDLCAEVGVSDGAIKELATAWGTRSRTLRDWAKEHHPERFRSTVSEAASRIRRGKVGKGFGRG